MESRCLASSFVGSTGGTKCTWVLLCAMGMGCFPMLPDPIRGESLQLDTDSEQLSADTGAVDGVDEEEDTGSNGNADTDSIEETEGEPEPETDTEDDAGDEEVEQVDGVSVYEIQQGAIDTNEVVLLQNAVVTSPLNAGAYGFFVQDEGGGPYSGLFVYLDDIEIDVQPGEVYNLSGMVKEYYDCTELVLDASSTIEISKDLVTPVVTALEEVPSDWEAYEGVLVRLMDVEVASDGDEYGEYQLEPWGIGLDDMFVSFKGEDGDGFSQMTGLLHFSHDEFKLEPRSTDDMLMLDSDDED